MPKQTGVAEGGAAHLVRGLQFEFLKDLLRLRFGGGHCAEKRASKMRNIRRVLLSSRPGVCLEKEKGERGRSRLRLAAPIGNLQYTLQYVTLASALYPISDHDSLFISFVVVSTIYYTCYFHNQYQFLC